MTESERARSVTLPSAAARKHRTGTQSSRLHKSWKSILNSLAFPLIILVIWESLAKSHVLPVILIPSLERIASTFVQDLSNGEIAGDIAVSAVRVIKGYLIGVVLGLTLGTLMGIFSRVNQFFSGIFDGIRQIPGLAWIPLLILWFGIGDLSKIVLIAKGTFFPILLNTIDGIRNTPKGYLELARLYHIRKRDLIRKVYLPSAIPFVLVGMRLGAGMAWMSVVAAEMLGSTSGIGYRMSDAQNLMQTDVLIVYMIVIGLVGGAVDLLLRVVTKRVVKWQA